MPTDHPAAPSSTRWLRRAGLVLCAACLSLSMSSAAALAEPPPAAPAPNPAPGPTAPAVPPPAAGATGGEAPQAIALNSLIDPAQLESVQQSIVGLVIVWSEHEDPFAWFTAPSGDPSAKPEPPVMSICTGWYDSPTTIATAGHCVDPEEGRVAMQMERGGFDPETGMPKPVDYSKPAPTATVYAFQPRELPGAVLTSPVIVRVHSFRKAEDGDTAKLEVHGMPPGKPLPIAPNPPRLGEPVTSIGFPGLNLRNTDGVDLEKLLEGGGQTPADILQDSRLHPVNTSGTIMSRQFRQGVAVYQVNADFAGGLSGGPTINSHGEVYGINSMMTLTLFGGGNFNVITDTGMLREFLEHDQPQPGPNHSPSRRLRRSRRQLPPRTLRSNPRHRPAPRPRPPTQRACPVRSSAGSSPGRSSAEPSWAALSSHVCADPASVRRPVKQSGRRRIPLRRRRPQADGAACRDARHSPTRRRRPRRGLGSTSDATVVAVRTRPAPDAHLRAA